MKENKDYLKPDDMLIQLDEMDRQLLQAKRWYEKKLVKNEGGGEAQEEKDD